MLLVFIDWRANSLSLTRSPAGHGRDSVWILRIPQAQDI